MKLTVSFYHINRVFGFRFGWFNKLIHYWRLFRLMQWWKTVKLWMKKFRKNFSSRGFLYTLKINEFSTISPHPWLPKNSHEVNSDKREFWSRSRLVNCWPFSLSIWSYNVEYARKIDILYLITWNLITIISHNSEFVK